MSTATTLHRLYTGEGGVDFVGRRKLWYLITGVVVAVAFIAMLVRGFTWGIDFEGGTKMNLPADGVDETRVVEVFEQSTGTEPQKVQVVGAGDSRVMEINSVLLSEEQITQAREDLFNEFHPTNSSGQETPDVIGDSTVSESWGSTITNRMLISFGVFLLLVFGYIAIRFERDMAIAAIAGLAVDAVVVAGIYSLIGFEVTPATIIGLLTVLAFSLYDTVVVFDKVKENTAGFTSTTRRTYAEQANLAVNQTVMRSISTTLFSALPILALMVVAVWLMGVGTLKDLSLVQLIGVIEGTFSSIFLATPILVSLKMRQKEVARHTEAVLAEREGDAARAEELKEQARERGTTKRHVDLSTRQDSSSATWRPGM